ncbi:MAG: tyrosine-type recombinase/integrase, partial [Candidatus Latescibacterota bacterium]
MSVKVREKPKGSGIWWLFIDHQGKRKAKKFGKDKRLALEAAKKIEAKLVLGTMRIEDEEDEVKKFEEYSRTWIEITVPATCKPSTLSDYQGILDNHVLPVFGKTPITKINRLAVKNFLMDKIKEGYAQSTVTHIKNALGGIFQLAVDDEVIEYNPAHEIGRIFGKQKIRLENHRITKMDPLTREELNHLLNKMREHFPRHYPLALTLARTGMRVGEAMALKWSDIDFNGRFITIQRGITRGRIETPKNGKPRRVDMSQQLADTLRALKEERAREGLPQVIVPINKGKEAQEQKPKLNCEWVFPNAEGNPLDCGNWKKRVFDDALKKAELRGIRVHDLRHTYASLLIQAGESLAYVKEQLGHHSIKVTVDIYGHMAPQGNKEAVDRLDDSATIRNPSATKNQKDSACGS